MQPSRAVSGGHQKLIWEQEAAGSNPAIPTAIFRMYCQLCRHAETAGGGRLTSVSVAV